MERFEHRIGGADVPPLSGEYLDTFDPTNGAPWARIARGDAADVERAVDAASDALRVWRRTSPSERAERIWRVADLIEEHAEELARLESRDIGKVIREMRGQLRGLPRWYRYFAGQVHSLRGDVIPLDNPTMFTYTRLEPYGVVGIIPSFNSPILLTTFALAPALAAGNTVVVKPSEHASTALLRFAALFDEAGLPAGAVNVVTGYGHEAGDALVQHPEVRKVAFTGGVETARAVARSAAEQVKPTILELGGKSANIVFPDADLDSAVNGIIAGIFAAAGQTCVAGSRLLVHDSIADRVVDAVAARARTIRMGDPLADETEMGPIAQQRIRDRVAERVSTAVAAGAREVAGGSGAFDGAAPGWFYPPTVLDGVTNDMEIAREELFGPVLSVLRFTDDDEALSIANDSPFGLAAGLWTRRLDRAHRMAAELEASTIWINTYRALNFAVPFGGRGLSGHGRELGREGLLEFSQTKSVWIETSEVPMGDPFTLR
jgi:(Z)-2-((N-methylformamido)methylene)-5-hydroxybutyrolactone dehydrogenase